MTFAQLLTMSDPPLDLLRLTKEFAKNHLADPLSPIPSEIASVLYFGAIAAALAHHAQSITNLDEKGIRDGFDWALNQQWIDVQLHELFTSAIGHLGAGPPVQ